MINEFDFVSVDGWLLSIDKSLLIFQRTLGNYLVMEGPGEKSNLRLKSSHNY